MACSENVRLKVELQASGARMHPSVSLEARSGGAGPAEGITIFFDDLVATIPTEAPYVSCSPFTVTGSGKPGRGLLFREGRGCREVEFAAPPRFYSEVTSSGVPLRKIALRHGRDAIGSTVVQSCARTTDACEFCGIALSRESGATTGRKEPADIARAASAASEEGFSHFVLTTGTTASGDRGIAHLEDCARAVKQATGGDMKVHVQFEPPAEDEWIERIAEVADSAAINMECFDEAVLSHVAPGKAAVGLAGFGRAWRRAVEAFGAGQVACFIIAGLGEDPESVLHGCEHLATLGVYPFVLPLRPIPGTPLGNCPAPPAGMMLGLYEKAAAIIQSAGLSASPCHAGCVRCGACSAITDW
ncbi:MAG: MSMEG_0568 family radical SAM protein [Candidatus Geothermincolia bacterium]